jgi:hypothetical protein
MKKRQLTIVHVQSSCHDLDCDHDLDLAAFVAAAVRPATYTHPIAIHCAYILPRQGQGYIGVTDLVVTGVVATHVPRYQHAV